MIRRRITLALAIAAVSAAAMAPAVAGSANAPDTIPGTAGARTITGAVEPPRPAFYEPPAEITGAPGTVIRTEPATFLLDPLKLSSTVVSATRVMYVSRDRSGAPIAVTGTVFVPKTKWVGTGPRPLITYAAGTQGMADRCAPSRQMSEFVQYEGAGFAALITRGYAVALTDYQGLGTPGSHTYMVRQSQGQVVLDMARAAQNLSGSGLTEHTPVGIMGYSQGGGAAASAAELAGTYAPELQVKGTLAGAVPADLARTGANLDGSLYSAFLAYAVVGLAEDNDLGLDQYLNPTGMDLMRTVEGSCVTDLLQFSFKRSTSITKDGRSLGDYFGAEPFTSVLAENRIGRIKPNAPVLLDHSALDDTIPYAVGKQLAKDWCAQGGNVRLDTNLVPTHIGGMTSHIALSLPFFEARFSGLRQPSSCWRL